MVEKDEEGWIKMKKYENGWSGWYKGWKRMKNCEIGFLKMQNYGKKCKWMKKNEKDAQH